jgi:hypothetical protein
MIPSGIFKDDGKRHINTTPVRLKKLNGLERIPHEGKTHHFDIRMNTRWTFDGDCDFVAASLRHIRDLASSFGNECVFYLIEDRKVSVRIGRPSARGHSPCIMHLDYQISSTSGSSLPSSPPHQLKPM